jgi:hypothetical protein
VDDSHPGTGCGIMSWDANAHVSGVDAADLMAGADPYGPDFTDLLAYLEDDATPGPGVEKGYAGTICNTIPNMQPSQSIVFAASACGNIDASASAHTTSDADASAQLALVRAQNRRNQARYRNRMRVCFLRVFFERPCFT